jgi:hypothetical protein
VPHRIIRTIALLLQGQSQHVPPVAVIHVNRSLAEPSGEALAGFSNVLRIPLDGSSGSSRVPVAAMLASGVPTSISGVELSMVLESEPVFHVRPRTVSDCTVPWVWDVVTQAGLKASVVGWPGFDVVAGSSARMVSSAGLHDFSRDSFPWPLATPFVEPPCRRDAVAASRVSIPMLDLAAHRTALDTMPPAVSGSNQTRLSLALTLSTLGAVDALASDGTDLAMISLPSAPGPLMTYMLDRTVRHLVERLGPDACLMIVSNQMGAGKLLAAGRFEHSVGPSTRGTFLDIAPTILSRLGVAVPEHFVGSDLLQGGSEEFPRLVTKTDEDVVGSEIDRLIDVLQSDDASSMHPQRRRALRRFTIRMLESKRLQAHWSRGFKQSIGWCTRLVDLDPSARNLWNLAFACDRANDEEGVRAASQRLLEEHPGSSEALLSAALIDPDAQHVQLTQILDAIDPASLGSPSMRGVWGRLSIRIGAFEVGIPVLKALVDQRVALPIDRFQLVRAWVQQGAFDQAATYLGSIGTAPRGALGWRLLRARVLLHSGREEEAQALAEAILDSYPMEPGATQIRDAAIHALETDN